jgi:hypothetical protein
MAQGERDAQSQEGWDQEEAHQQAQKLTAQRERTRKKAESKRIRTREAEKKKTKGGKGASGWVQVPMRDDHGQVLYYQSGHVRYHPQDGHQDGQTKKKKKPPPVRPNSPTISDYANGHQYSSDQGVNENKNYPPGVYRTIYMGLNLTRIVLNSSQYRITTKVT